MIKTTHTGALAKTTLVFIFFVGTEGDPGCYKLVCPISVTSKLIKLKKILKNTAIKQLENHDKMRAE